MSDDIWAGLRDEEDDEWAGLRSEPNGEDDEWAGLRSEPADDVWANYRKEEEEDVEYSTGRQSVVSFFEGALGIGTEVDAWLRSATT